LYFFQTSSRLSADTFLGDVMSCRGPLRPTLVRVDTLLEIVRLDVGRAAVFGMSSSFSRSRWERKKIYRPIH